MPPSRRKKERAGEKPKESSESLNRKAVELDARLRKRLALLDHQQLMSTKPPRIVTAALVLPVRDTGDRPTRDRAHPRQKETKEVERRGVDLVMARERELGRKPVEQAFNNPGFDILSTDAKGDTYRIEVKARIEGATDFFVTHNEVMVGKNAAPRYRLALVRVDPRGAQHDEVRYLDNPFATTDLGDFNATGIRGDWSKQWAKEGAVLMASKSSRKRRNKKRRQDATKAGHADQHVQVVLERASILLGCFQTSRKRPTLQRRLSGASMMRRRSSSRVRWLRPSGNA